MAAPEILADNYRFDLVSDNLNQKYGDTGASFGVLLTETKVMFHSGDVKIARIHVGTLVDDDKVIFRITTGSKSKT